MKVTAAPKGQWERRLQTDIHTARQALRDALSLDLDPSPTAKTEPACAAPGRRHQARRRRPGGGDGVKGPEASGSTSTMATTQHQPQCSG
uniref:Uncharacterized protein n=1 Tax=Oryza glaberrima TaxID=4538 RepID=I1PUF6_ORYGL